VILQPIAEAAAALDEQSERVHPLAHLTDDQLADALIRGLGDQTAVRQEWTA
jgi:hypothetical protein